MSSPNLEFCKAFPEQNRSLETKLRFSLCQDSVVLGLEKTSWDLLMSRDHFVVGYGQDATLRIDMQDKRSDAMMCDLCEHT